MLIHGTATAELRRIVAELDAIGAGAHREEMSASLAAEGIVLIKSGFENSRSPDGTPWEPLKLRHGNPLVDTGRLRNSFIPRISPSGFEIEATNVKYAGVHQFGATIVPKKTRALHFRADGRWFFAKKVEVPAREFIPTGPLPSAWASKLEAVARKVLARFLPSAEAA